MIVSKIRKAIKYSQMLQGGLFSLVQLYGVYLFNRLNIRIKEKIIWFYIKKYGIQFGVRTNTSDAAMLWVIGLAGEYDLAWQDDFSPNVIIDAGGNVGYFSMVMASRFPKAKIIVIEPDDGNYIMLLENIKNLKANITPIKGGLWNKDTKLCVKNDGNAMGVTVYESHDGKVAGYNLNSIVRILELEKIDLIKIDIEGSEYEVFSSGYEEWISMPDCYIIETHNYLKAGAESIVKKRLIDECGYDSFEHGEDVVYYKNGLLKEDL